MMEFLPDELEHLLRLHVFSADNKVNFGITRYENTTKKLVEMCRTHLG